MRPLPISRDSKPVLGVVGAFLLVLVLVASTLLWNLRRDTLAASQAQAVRFVSGAEAALNRALLGVDMLLASTDELLALGGTMPDWIDANSASARMRSAVQPNLLVRHVALLTPQGRVLASSDPDAAQLQLGLPAGYLQSVWAEPVSTLVLSAPVLSPVSSEQVLYMARTIKLADSSRVVVVAEVPVPMLVAILIQGADISGLQVTLERADGQLLASAPAFDQLLGRRLVPALGTALSAGAPRLQTARLGGEPAIVATRPLLYRDLLIAASVPLQSALHDWRTDRFVVLLVSLLLALLVVAAGVAAVWHLERMAQSRRAMTQAKATLDQALESMESGFLLLDASRQVIAWNRRFCALYPWLTDLMAPGLAFPRILDETVLHQLPHADAAARALWIERRLALLEAADGSHEQAMPDGRVIEVTERATPEGGVVIVYQDVTALRRARAEVETLAFYDPLTQLPNRRLLLDRLRLALATSARSGQLGVLLFLDLDHFKTLNDTLGHDVGDLLLRQVATRLLATVREEDTVARLGGDEFVVMLEGLSAVAQQAAEFGRRVGEKIVQQLEEPFQLGALSYQISCSVGATLLGAGGSAAANSAELLKRADIAMYEVKSHGRNALCFFDPQMQADISARAQLEKDLHAALAHEQFELHYQPQVAQGGRVVGAEVLIRWNHPTRGRVAPNEFIAAAEMSDLIVSIGRWVLRTACQRLALWRLDGRAQALHLCVNVSARQFRQTDFVEQVTQVILDTGINPGLLKLELTESLVIEDLDDAIAKMSQLQGLGVLFSVDDFGTGSSSLAYLTRLPLSQLKIDQSFVRNIGVQRTDGVIVQTIIGMARNLGLEVIAEGVETLAQQAFLASHGCTLYQGYLMGKPMPVAEFEALLRLGDAPAL